jgi:hypothetical protein
MQHYQDLDYLEIIGTGTVALVLDLHSNHEETTKTAQLIAAAPELLEAGNLLFDALTNWIEIADDEDVRDSDQEAVAKWMIAISKAKGE